MTLSQSDVCELLEAIRAGGDLDVIRRGWSWCCRR